MINHVSPQFRRNDVEILDGIYSFRFDKNHIGEKEKFYEGFKKEHEIRVPFSYTCKASNIDIKEHVDTVWYSRNLTIKEEDLSKDLYLHFEGVDEIATIFINGHLVGIHQGGNTAFKVLINREVKVGDNLLVIKVEDDNSLAKGRGKQRWLEHMYGCWYIPTYGIYKPVYLERANHTHIDYFKLSPKMDEAKLDIDYVIANMNKDLSLKIRISLEGKLIREVVTSIDADSGRLTVALNSAKLEYQVMFWAPHDPHLYDIELILIDEEKEIDHVDSYFGVVEYTVSNDHLLLNGFSYVSKMVLYQGYFKDSYLTPQNDEEMINDIKNIKAMGFNGVRCHQYIPTERFLYLCDLLGLSVWIEYPSQHLFNQKANDIILQEWRDIIKAKYNHPCVFAYVLYNESWGIRGVKTNKEQQDFVKALYQLTKSFDPIRPVISNDGWEHIESDILTIHCYWQDAEEMKKFLEGQSNLYFKRDNWVNGQHINNKPVFLTEYGGCTLGKIEAKAGEWGYGDGAVNQEEFFNRLASFQKMIKEMNLKGYCYTQYKDVQQEKNGFVDEEGNLKVDPKKVLEILAKNI